MAGPGRLGEPEGAALPPSGFQAELALWSWALMVLLHGLGRSFWPRGAEDRWPTGGERR